GSDAASMYQAELTKAKGTPDDSGAVTVTGDDYYLKDVSLGDEAFCTKEGLSTVSSGVLARKGNTLVYVSIIDSSTAGNQQNADETNCTNAQKLATKVLG